MSSNVNFHSALLQQIEAHAATKSPGQIFASLFIDSDSIFHNTQFVESLSFVVARSFAENYLVRFNFRINYYFSSEIFLLSRDRGARRRGVSTALYCLPGADVSVFIRRDYSDLTQRIEPSNVPPRCLFIHSDIIIAAQPPRCSDCVDTRMHTKLQSVEGMEK